MSYGTELKINESIGQGLLALDEDEKEFMPLEGECRIEDVRPMQRLGMARLILTLVGFLFGTLFVIGLLALRYSKRLRARLLYNDCTFHDATHVLISGNDGSVQIEDITVEETGRKVFSYRMMKYCHGRSKFHPVGYSPSRAGHLFNQSFYPRGLTEDQEKAQRKQYGRCEHKVEIPTYFQYMGAELIKPFFILQYIVCVSYILEKNYMFAAIMLALSFITTSINYIMLRLSFKKIKEIAEHSAEVQVLRNGVRVKMDSTELVPGDIFHPDEMIPCDCVLISGEVFVNQASLTGENIPIGKFPALAAANLTEDNCWLFEGAKVLELRNNPTALVVNTGFATRKGRIFRKILHNNPTQPEYFASAIKFLGIMFLCVYIIYFGFVAFMLEHKVPALVIFYRALDMIGWAAPAAFPIYFNLCYSLGLGRLRRSNIYGTEPQKTVVAGKIKTMCFDKTGTLTLNSMSLFSIHRILGEDSVQQILASEVQQKDKDAKDIMYKFFASCHTVRRIQEQFMGDQLDLRMFQFAGFSFELPQDSSVNIRSTNRRDGSHIDVLRINQFESKFQCMSVLVKDVGENKYYAFVKGAAQKMERCSVNKYLKYDELISSLSLAGLRNIAFGYKQVSEGEVQSYLTCKREQFEKGLTLLGVVAFENKLKDDTVDTLRKLMDAHIEPKIITGDNIYIAVETALRTGILPHGSQILLFEGRKQRNAEGKYNGIILTHDKVKSHSQQVELTKEEYASQKLPIGIDNDFLHLHPAPELPSTVKLFARISPESKAAIVRRLIEKNKHINPNWKVGMCGDGANDLMAIKEADAGMGISDTDSSFAANFSIPQLKGVEQIIRDGKATLSNVIEIFIFYGATSFVKATSSFVLMYDLSYLNGTQITFFNYSSTLILCLLLSISGPAETLSSLIPNDNFMGWENALIYIINWLFPTAGLILVEYFLWTQTDIFTPQTTFGADWLMNGYTNTTILLCLELILVGVIFSIYRANPFKKQICYNIPMTILLILDVVGYIAMFFITKSHFMGLVELKLMFAGGILGISLATIAVTAILTILVRLYWKRKAEKELEEGDQAQSVKPASHYQVQ